MAFSESTFLSYIRMVLKKWTGLQLAIMEGMGGPYSNEKEIWFGTEIEKFFKNNDDLLPYEVEDFMSTILDAEFNTIAEDGSLTEIAGEFCKIYHMCKSGSEREVLKLITPQATDASSATKISTFISGTVVEEEDKNNKELLPQIQNLNLNADVATEALSDGWTEVRRGRKKKSG